jgi:hypothetical protein
MPALLIKDVPPELHRKLKELASRNRRSMNRQALVLLEEALERESGKAELPPPLKGRIPLTRALANRARRAGRP